LDWRLILDDDLPGHENMARDSSILRALEEGSGTPTLRVYGWAAPTISIGYLQDPAPFSGLALPVVRRITGGRAVVHSSEVTYSVTGLMDNPLFSGGIMAAYSVISACIIAALNDAGVDATYSRGSVSGIRNEACFHAATRYEVLVGGRKLVGSAQRRLKRAFIQHGSILMDTDDELNQRVFGRSLSGKMAGVSEFSGVVTAKLKELLVERFAQGFDASFKVTGLTVEEKRDSDDGAGSCLIYPGAFAEKSAARA
jgi:lipoate-protein ligase A